MRILFLLVIYSLSLLNANSQENALQTYEIGADSNSPYILNNSFWQLLPDLTGKLTIQNVNQRPFSDSFRNQVLTETLSHEMNLFWIRFKIRNELLIPARISLENITNADRIDYYVSGSNFKWSHFSTGNLVPWSEKDGVKKLNYIPLIIEAGKEIEVYGRIENHYYFNFPRNISVSFINSDDVLGQYYAQNNKFYFYERFNDLTAGIMFFAIILGLSFFSMNRDKVFLYYSLFLTYFSFDNISDLILNPIFRERPQITLFIYTMVKAAGVLFMSQFVRHFLKTYIYYPKWDKVLKVASAIQVLGFIFRFFAMPHLTWELGNSISYAASVLFDISIILVACTLFYFIKKQDRFKRILFISTIPSFLFWTIGFAILIVYDFRHERYSIPYPPIINWFFNWFEVINSICVSWFAVSFSWILIMQYLQLKKETSDQVLEKEKILREKEIEKNQLIELQKTNLEKTVLQRTSELKKSLEELKSAQSQLIKSAKMASL
ncbi:MAG: 7TM-DISM domain-containing protein, partial [Bacteroidota bacterium]